MSKFRFLSRPLLFLTNRGIYSLIGSGYIPFRLVPARCMKCNTAMLEIRREGRRTEGGFFFGLFLNLAPFCSFPFSLLELSNLTVNHFDYKNRLTFGWRICTNDCVNKDGMRNIFLQFVLCVYLCLPSFFLLFSFSFG